MSNIKTGGRAFPNDPVTYDEGRGMTLRDYFAAKAIQGRLAGNTTWHEFNFKPTDGLGIIENECLLAYRIADAMLAARGQA